MMAHHKDDDDDGVLEHVTMNVLLDQTHPHHNSNTNNNHNGMNHIINNVNSELASETERLLNFPNHPHLFNTNLPPYNTSNVHDDDDDERDSGDCVIKLSIDDGGDEDFVDATKSGSRTSMQGNSNKNLKKSAVAECRICQEEDEYTNLESPCACSGSLKVRHHIHTYLLTIIHVYIKRNLMGEDDAIAMILRK